MNSPILSVITVLNCWKFVNDKMGLFQGGADVNLISRGDFGQYSTS